MRFATMVALFALIGFAGQPALAQGKGKGKEKAKGEEGRGAGAETPGKGPKRYAIKSDRAVVVTREVLVKRGFVVDRVEDKGELITVWYYRGNMGKGRGKGPLQKMIIRRVDDRVVFEEAPRDVMVDIDVRLKL